MSTLWTLLMAGVLFAAACACVFAELGLPAHGLLAVLAAGFAIGGVMEIYTVSPLGAIVAALALIGVQPIFWGWAVRRYPDTWIGRRILLRKPAAVASVQQAEQGSLASLLGKNGTALTLMRPAGACEIDGQRIDAVSEGPMIEPGTAIQVTRVLGVRVIVRQV